MATVLAATLLIAAPAKAAFGRHALHKGMHGREVKTLQRLLTDLGYKTARDGAYGRRTARQVRRYERAVHEHVDGRMSRPELRRLARRAKASRHAKRKRSDDAPSPSQTLGSRPLERGDEGDDVAQLQTMLDQIGYPTAADGDFGPATERSVKSYQRDAGIDPDGVVTASMAADIEKRAADVDGGSPDSGDQQPASAVDGVFPLRGSHSFGTRANRFGAGRSGHTHQGQDILARCGKRVLAAEGGKVRFNSFQSAAGNYVVIHAQSSGYDEVYMHLMHRSPLREGQRVSAGQKVGNVGQTGDATGCHLHFEMWTRPGWYDGGSPIDPLPSLKSWDSGS